jgi:hypothetical protein
VTAWVANDIKADVWVKLRCDVQQCLMLCLWLLAPCWLVGRFQSFGDANYPLLQDCSGDAACWRDLCRVGRTEGWGIGPKLQHLPESTAPKLRSSSWLWRRENLAPYGGSWHVLCCDTVSRWSRGFEELIVAQVINQFPTFMVQKVHVCVRKTAPQVPVSAVCNFTP